MATVDRVLSGCASHVSASLIQAISVTAIVKADCFDPIAQCTVRMGCSASEYDSESSRRPTWRLIYLKDCANCWSRYRHSAAARVMVADSA